MRTVFYLCRSCGISPIHTVGTARNENQCLKCFKREEKTVSRFSIGQGRRKYRSKNSIRCKLRSDKILRWKRLRYLIINLYGTKCMCCGSTPDQGAAINVDHIKPKSKFPDLEFNPRNLQILCSDCNHGKFNIDYRDFRSNEDISKLEIFIRESSEDDKAVFQLKPKSKKLNYIIRKANPSLG